ncbi:MAG: Coenzyme F420 hydrogenase/dehydrogenase, beta subunit C-terminal domain [Candidatus Aminicenantes bacterium]|nr:MAG: Coenzyme F420 hydrogenase/dehydrogenase, beta subunit C-terminal domain [Candidatus Aminicenantes bacterium]
MVNVEDLKKEAKKVLEEGKVKYIIGYERGTNGVLPIPAFIKNPEDVDRLIWNPACVYNLSRFLLDEKRSKTQEKEPDERPVGLVVKGCDSRAINILLQEKFINRDDVFIIGVSCENTGVLDEKKLAKKLKGKQLEKIEFGEKDKFIIKTKDGKVEMTAEEILAERCLECKANFPIVYDVLIGEKVERPLENPFKSVEKMESLPKEEKWAFWKEQIDKCIRCYACRSVCPMCYCDECVADTISFAVTADTTSEEKAQKIKWIEKSPVSSENFVYHLIRAIHLAGRCIDCGECERVCPVNIPLRFLNKKLEKEAKELFGYEVGFDPDQPSLVSSFKDEDPEDFIR